MSFSRASPSPRYLELQGLYRQLHGEGEKFQGLKPEQTYPGISLLPHLSDIKAMVEAFGARTILDYGCGKGTAYSMSGIEVKGFGKIDNVLDYWDVDSVHCYDPCYQPYSRVPQERFDGVVSTDVLEHCPEEDLSWIVGEIFGYAERFVFASVACYPAKSRLPTGENAHCTVRSAQWWEELFARAATSHPAIAWRVCAISIVGEPQAPRVTTRYFGSGVRG